MNIDKTLIPMSSFEKWWKLNGLPAYNPSYKPVFKIGFTAGYKAGMEQGAINANAELTLLRIELAHLKAKDSKLIFGEIEK